MAIRDLLWACPRCGAEGGIRPDRRGERCFACGTRYRRGEGATIVAEAPDGRSTALPAPAWLDRLPPVRLPWAEKGGEGERGARVVARFAEGEERVYRGAALLGTIERFGPERPGTLVLAPGEVRFRGDDGEEHRWPFDRLTAVQASSSSLQIKARDEPLVSFRFRDASIHRWEVLLEAALREHYRAHGRGEILEFQPRIAVR